METEQEEREDYTGVKTKDLKPKQRRARKAARKGNYTDRDLNGIPDRDELDFDELDAEWQWVSNLISESEQLAAIFEKAANEGAFETETGINNFLNDIMESDWWKENAEPARQAFALRSTDPAQYGRVLDSARNAVRARAQELGAQLDSGTLENLANQYVVEGWDDAAYLMDNALSSKIGMAESGKYVAGDFAETLRRTAMNNGLQYDDQYYISAARSVASGLRSEDSWLRDIREEAASYWPVYGDQIRSGVDARQLLSGYMNVMSRTLEIDPMSISLDDPYLRQATTSLDDSGKPRAQSLWEFQQALRDDPRWLNTDQAVKRQTDIGAGILRRFGIL